jgi:phospholipid/cholesterol/gamma-HCH transport system substrate-binding protein
VSWWRRQMRGSTLRFSLYTLLCLVLLGGLIVRIGQISLFTHRVSYRAEMTDVTGLGAGDAVKLAGVTVGQVKSITTDHGLAVVQFAVNRNVFLPSDVQDGIRWQNVLGQKYFYLYASRSTGTRLAPGATIPPAREEADADIGAFLDALGPVLQSIDPSQANAFVEGVLGGLQDNLDQVGSLIDNAATVSTTVGNLNVQIGSVIDNLSTVMGALGARRQDLQNVVANLATISTALASRNQTLDDVVANFSKVSGEFANVISNNRSNLDSIISSLDTVAKTLQSHRGDLDQDLTTLSAGLEPYTLISSYGQWFNVQTVYVCLADQTSCQYQEGGPKPSKVSGPSSPAASPALRPVPASASAPAPSAAQLRAADTSTPGGTSLGQLLARLAGSGS